MVPRGRHHRVPNERDDPLADSLTLTDSSYACHTTTSRPLESGGDMQDECRRYLEVGLDNLHKDVKRAEEGEVQGPMDGMRMSAATVAAGY